MLQTLESPTPVQDISPANEPEAPDTIAELSDLELALVGGGIGAVSWG